MGKMESHTVKGNEPFSEEQMFKKFRVDPEKREAARLKHNVRPTSMKRADGEIAQILNYQTTLFLQRKFPEFFEEIQPFLEEFISAEPPTQRPKTTPSVVSQTSKQLATTLYADAHVDKQGSASEKQRKKEIVEADERLTEKMDKFGFNHQLFTILGDFFNTDGNYKTTRGTEQQNMLSEYEGWKMGINILSEVIQRKSRRTSVDVILTQGNHDEHKLAYLRDVLFYYFEHNDNVNIVKVEENGRYIYERGDCLLGFTHGHTANLKDLPMFMNHIGAKHKERFTAHKHKALTTSYHGLHVNTLAAMKPLSGWNDKYGVDHTNDQMFGVMHHENDGKIAQFYEKIR